MMRRRYKYLLLALAAFLFVGGIMVYEALKADAFWRWGGRRLVQMVQDRVQGEVQVREIKGTPLSGLVFKDLAITGPEGPVLKAGELKLRFSLWSFIKLHPVVSELTLARPRATVRQDGQGRWQWLGLKPTWGPGEAPLPFRSLAFSRVAIKEGEVEFLGREGRRDLRDLDLDLALKVSQPLGPAPALEVSRGRLTATTAWGRLGFETCLGYREKKLDLRYLTVTAADRTLLSLTGEVDLAAAPVGLNLSLELGPLPGAQVRDLLPRWPEAWEPEGRVSLAGSLARLEVKGEGALKGALVRVQGGLKPGLPPVDYDLNLDLERVSPALLADLNQDWESRLKPLGELSARLQLKGAGDRLDWSLESGPFSYQGARCQELKASLTGAARDQSLKARLAGNFGEVDLSAGGNLLASRGGELQVKARGLKPAHLGWPELSGSEFSGSFSGRFRLPGAAPAGPWLTGEVEARGQVGQQPLRELKGSFAWDGVRLAVPRARVSLGALAAEVKGSLDRRGLDVSGRGSLTLDGSTPWLPGGWRGRLEGEGGLKGPWAAPQLNLQAKARGLAGEGFKLETLNLKVAAAGWPPQAGTLEAQGTNFTTLGGTLAQVRLSSRGEGKRWRFDFQGQNPEGARAEARGGTDFATRPYGVVLEQCRLEMPGLKVYNTAPVQARLAPGWEILPAAFRLNEGQLKLQMQVQSGRVSGRLEADSLPANLLCIQGVPCQGRIQAQADISGEPLYPAIQGNITWGPGHWGDFTFQLFKTSFNYRDETFTLNGSLEEKPLGPRLSWDGRVPLRLALLPPQWDWGERDLYLKVQGENANLALLTALTPEVTGAEGAVDIMAEWQGRPRQPRVSGQIRWGPGYLTVRESGARFRLLPGAARLQGDSLMVPEILLESGGTARVSGAITLATFLPQQLDLKAELHDFLGLHRTGSQARGTGTVTLRGPLTAPRLGGHLTLSQASFTPVFFQRGIHRDIVLAPPPSPPKPGAAPGLPPLNLNLWRNLEMDLVLEAPGGVWVRDKRLNVEFAGRVRAMKHSGDKRTFVGGEAKALKGTYELQGRIFKVEKGLLHFPGNPKMESTVDGQAVHKMEGLTLILTAAGPVIKPEVKLESIPPLPPSDLLAYLVFGRPAGSLSREEYLSMGQAAIGVIGGITAQKVQELLGKDFPLVGNVTLKGGVSEGHQLVGVTKPLTQDLSVTFERKTSPVYRDDTNQVRLEYKLGPHFSVESQMGRRNTGADVLFNWDF
jgi:translocation and assembly module TamB